MPIYAQRSGSVLEGDCLSCADVVTQATTRAVGNPGRHRPSMTGIYLFGYQGWFLWPCVYHITCVYTYSSTISLGCFFSPKIIFEDWSRAVYVFEKRRLPFLLMIYYDLPMCFLKIKITNHHHYYYLLWLTNDLLWFIIIWGYLDILITNSSPWLEDQVGKMPNCAGRCLA